MNTKFSVITTFNEDGYNKYAQRMIQTFLANWPQEVNLYAYAEDCTVKEQASNLFTIDLHNVSPELVAFKNKWKNVPKAVGAEARGIPDKKGKVPGIGFKWDAVRFSHKVYSIFHAAKTVNTDFLIWMDADMVCHSPINVENIKALCPDNIDIGFLGRKGKYTECGLYALNLNSPSTKDFLKIFQEVYDQAENGIFLMGEWHDSFVFDRVKEVIPLVERDWSAGLITGEGHPLINCEWGKYLDHLKGKRKELGKSSPKDLKVPREEVYWQ